MPLITKEMLSFLHFYGQGSLATYMRVYQKVFGLSRLRNKQQ